MGSNGKGLVSESPRGVPAVPLPAFHVMTKPIGPLCNLDCKYCFYLEKEQLYPATSHWRMSDELLESYIRQYIEAQQVPVVSFAWQGGEPTLLGVDFFRKVVAIQQKYANGKQIQNALQTNAVSIDDEWAGFLANHRFLVGASVDGPRNLHDFYRVDKGGQPTFDRVMAGIQKLQKYAVEFNSLTCVNAANSRHPLEVYRFLKEIGGGCVQFIPIVERRTLHASPNDLVLIGPNYRDEAEVTEWSVDPVEYGRFLCAIFDEWVRHDVGTVFIQTFEVALESWAGIPQSLCVFRPTCGTAMAVEHNGDLYSCDHFVYPQYKLGNILEQPLFMMAASQAQVKFGLDKSAMLPRYCRECEVRFACNGECPKHRFLKTPDGESGLNYLCAGYKLFFRHIAPYMAFMVQQLEQRRSPANVMRWAQQEDSGRKATGRNEICPCGSGKKFKRCCGLHN